MIKITKKEKLINEAEKKGVKGNIKEVKRVGNILKIKTGMGEIIFIEEEKRLICRKENLTLHWKLGKEVKEKRKFMTEKWKRKKGLIIIDGKTGEKSISGMEKFIGINYKNI